MSEKGTILTGERALELWLRGREAWNAWVEDNPKANIDFTGMNFGDHRARGKNPAGMKDHDEWPFAGFRFPEGKVSFDGAQFGDGGVYFDEAQFGNERVSFTEAQFGEGDVVFIGAQFGAGDVSFSFAKFGEGVVSFEKAQFGNGNVSFDFAQFGDEEVFFHNATFGEGDLTFAHSVFGGRAIFSDLRNVEKLTGLSFLYATFDKGFVLSLDKNLPLGCVPDLRGCQFNHHLVLDRIRCKPRDVRKSEDASRLCRLKEIAEGNKDHDSALHFNALELQTRELSRFQRRLEQLYGALSDYGRSIGRPLIWLVVLWLVSSLLYTSSYFPDGQLLFQNTASLVFLFLILGRLYGCSIERPLICLVVLWLWFFCGLGYLVHGIASGGEHSWITPFVFSAKQMFPLLPVLRDLGLEGQNIPEIVKIAREGSNVLMLALMFFQNIASLVLLFLLGLGLRNRFRV